MGGARLVGGRVVISNRSPEASAGGRFFLLSAHARRPARSGRAGGLRGGAGSACGADLSPEPPLPLLLGGRAPSNHRSTLQPDEPFFASSFVLFGSILLASFGLSCQKDKRLRLGRASTG